MPVRNISSSEVGIGRTVGYHASSLHLRHSSGSDDASGSQLFVNRPRKQKKSDGINGRMNRMLLRLNTSFIGELSTSNTTRLRNPSVVSAASTLSTEPPRTPIDVFNNTVRSNNLGDGFTIIRTSDSKKRNRPDFLTNKDLLSWRDSERYEESKQETHQRELPEWLSHTFSTLESDHPLRALALPIHSSPVKDERASYVFEDTSAFKEEPHVKEIHNGAIFAFLPPSDIPTVQDGLQSVSPLKREPLKSPSIAEYTNYAFREQLPSLHADNASADHEFIPDDVDYGNTMDLAAEKFTPFAEPGPFAQKTVHFLTPDRSSIFSPSHYSASPSLLPVDQHHTYYKPFSTPGPASFPSFVNSNYSVSDSTTLADYALTDDHYDMADDTNEEDATFSVLSFNSSANNPLDKAFSTSGPALYASQLQYLNTQVENPLLSVLNRQLNDDMELELCQPFSNEQQAQVPAAKDPLTPIPDTQPNNIGLELEQLVSDEHQIQAQKMIRFIEREHSEMLRGMRTPPAVDSKTASAQGDAGQEVNLDAAKTLKSDPNPDSREENPQDFVQHGTKSGTQAAPIEVFSSPPYIRFMPARPSRPKNPVTTKDNKVIKASPDLRLDRLPSPVNVANRTGLNDASTMPRTPTRPNLQNAGSRNDMNAKVTQAPESALLEERRREDPKAPTPNTKPGPRKQRKQRRAFAPAPGVYLSPIRSADNDGECTMDDGTSRQPNESNGTKDGDEGIWNINPSQISDDSIENWEV